MLTYLLLWSWGYGRELKGFQYFNYFVSKTKELKLDMVKKVHDFANKHLHETNIYVLYLENIRTDSNA